jgi:methyl-accepting chemotaxis protein
MARRTTKTTPDQILDYQGQLKAISRVMAVIEFSLDGIVLDVNDNFLSALGYTKEEIVGKHHRMFVDPKFAASAEYGQFWADLAAGRPQAAEFRRVGKGGKDVWIQASYNPILDAEGKPWKVVKYATDITAQKAVNLDRQGQLQAISRSMATIEFGLDGIVLDANANFLSALGYTKEEVVGKPHRMFVQAAYAASPEYALFWSRLNAGEAQTAEFRRVGKGGKDVWIQASYNPILNADGKPIKVVKYATDITAQKAANLDRQGQIQAISRSNAVIEFGLDGVVLDVNDNFLNALGYTKSEIVGKHHRMFVDPTYAASPAYAEFWSRLNAGETQAAEFVRIGKGGKQVWIQASYNPIFDADGKPYKVVKFATDITAQNAAARKAIVEGLRIQGALDGTTAALMITDENFNLVYANDSSLTLFRAHEAAIQKDLPGFKVDKLVGSNMDVFHKHPQHQRQMLAGLQGHHRAQVKLGGRVLNLVAGVARDSEGHVAGFSMEWADATDEVAAQTEVARVLDAAVAGDLTQRIDAERFTGFLRGIGENMNSLIDSVADSFSSVKLATEQIGQAATQLRATSQLMSSSSVQLNQAAEASSGALVKVAEGVRANADNAAMANQLVTQTSTAAQSGQGRMEEMSTAMGAINSSAQQIAKIIKVIDEIAFQTNLLALNAAVEAARAGRHGKGFAVVAQEVRSLAERSAKAAKETATLIEDSVAKVGQGVTIADATRGALKEIVSNVVKVVDLAGDIAAASNEQSTAVASVSDSMRQVTEGAQAGSQQSNEVAAAAEEMGRQMAVLKERLDKYKVRSHAGNGANGLPAGVPQALFDQVMAALRASGVALPQAGPAPKAAGADGAAGANGHAKSNGHTNGSADARALLPLDRDERGFNGF